MNARLLVRSALMAMLSVVVGAGLMVGGASSAEAKIVSAGGGVWNTGRHVTVWSNYYHLSKNHRSTACNERKCNKSSTVAPWNWSYASIEATWSNNTTYWATS